MTVFESLREYINEVSGLAGYGPIYWTSDGLKDGGKRKDRVYGFVHMISAAPYGLPLYETHSLESGMLKKTIATSSEESWGLQIWGEKAYDTAYALQSLWSSSDAALISKRKKFAVTSVSEILALSAIRSLDRLAIDYEISYTRILDRFVSLDGNVIETIPVTVRRENLTEEFSVTKGN